jgi:hypothetical protein
LARKIQSATTWRPGQASLGDRLGGVYELVVLDRWALTCEELAAPAGEPEPVLLLLATGLASIELTLDEEDDGNDGDHGRGNDLNSFHRTLG